MRHPAYDLMSPDALRHALRSELATAEMAFCPDRAYTAGGRALKRAVAIARELELRGEQGRLFTGAIGR